MEIIEQTDNKLLHRKEILIEIESDSAPSNKEVLDKISEQFKTDNENIVVVYIKGKFGSNKFKVFAKIYDNVESREKYEVITKKEKKKKAEEEKKKAEEAKKAKAEAEEAKKAAAEKPAEENTEQSKETPIEIQEEAQPEQEPKQEIKPEGNKPEEEQ